MVDNVKARSNIKLALYSENIAGVHLPIFKLREIDEDCKQLDYGKLAGMEVPLGLTGGGKAISKCKDKFKDLLELLVRIASLQTSFLTLDEVIKITNRRVNALDYVVVPRFISNISYIIKELDEMDREDFFRLKRVTDKKKIAKEKHYKEKDLMKKIMRMDLVFVIKQLRIIQV